MSPVKFIGALTTFVFALITISIVSNVQSVKATSPTMNMERIPLEVEPICSSESRSISEWTVTNKNTLSVDIQWDNFENKLSGIHSAPTGKSIMVTGYVANDPNNTTRFTYREDQTLLGQTNATKKACEETSPPALICVDGTKHDNLFAQYLTDNTIQINTKDDAPLCEDVVLYFSSYVMPRNYDGKDFTGNSTAYPQSIHDSVRVVLEKGTSGTAVAVVGYPLCENVQFDLYYGPEITVVGENGHGTQNILSNVLLRDKDICEIGNGSIMPTPVVPMPTPVVTAPTVPVSGMGTSLVANTDKTTDEEYMPTELPQTGSTQSVPIMLVGVIFALFTYISLYALQPKRP